MRHAEYQTNFGISLQTSCANARVQNLAPFTIGQCEKISVDKSEQEH